MEFKDTEVFKVPYHTGQACYQLTPKPAVGPMHTSPQGLGTADYLAAMMQQ